MQPVPTSDEPDDREVFSGSLHDHVKERETCAFWAMGCDNNYIQNLVKKFGYSKDDEKFMDLGYSLFGYQCTGAEGKAEEAEMKDVKESGATAAGAMNNFEVMMNLGPRKTSIAKVEIEDTDDLESVERQAVIQHLESLLKTMLSSGIMLWSLLLGYAVLASIFPVCASAAYPALGALGFLLLYRINVMTKMLSRTTFEGRPFVRFMYSLEGFDNYRVLTGLALLDLSARFTRALFASQAFYCSSELNDRLVASTSESSFAILAPAVKYLKFGGICAISFLGSNIIQGAFMLWSIHTVRGALTRAKMQTEGAMGVSETLDDYGAVADWAMLNPVAKIFSLAAIPLFLEDGNDAYRIWDQMRTHTIRVLVRILPDTMVSMYLQAKWFELNVDEMPWMVKVQRGASLFSSWASAMNVARHLIKMQHALPVVAGFTIILLGTFPCITIGMSLWE